MTATLALPPEQRITLALTAHECRALGARLLLARALAGRLSLIDAAYHRRGPDALAEAARDAAELRDALAALHEQLGGCF